MLLNYSRIDFFDNMVVYQDLDAGCVEFFEAKNGSGFKARYRNLANNSTRPIQIASIQLVDLPPHSNLMGFDQRFIDWAKSTLSFAPSVSKIREFLDFVADVPLDFEDSPNGNSQDLQGRRVQQWMHGTDLAYRKLKELVETARALRNLPADKPEPAGQGPTPTPGF